MLLSVIGLVQADDDDVCEPFMDGKVDESLLATMLSAAHNGHLYRIHQDSSQVGFCVNSKLSRIEGNFSDFRGGMNLNRGHRGNGQTMVLIRADSLNTENALINSMVKGESFFDVENYPEVLFVSHEFSWTGPDTAVLAGDLTLRGITRPVTFDVTLTPVDSGQTSKKRRILVKATTTINRVEFGMEKFASMVDNDVQLCMTVEAQKYETISNSSLSGDKSTDDPAA
jgi:polyisoprenoid-binding protein YceI